MNTPTYTNRKEGLIRSFLTVIVGVLILSYVGFDLRARIAEFQTEYATEISIVESFIQNTLIPTTADIFNASIDVAQDNNINQETVTNFVTSTIEFIKQLFSEN